jgi:hypothetical protein
VFGINLKNNPSFSDQRYASGLCHFFCKAGFGTTYAWCKTLAQNIGDEWSWRAFTLSFEEHEEHWFLAELCKAEKGVKKTSEINTGQRSLGGV